MQVSKKAHAEKVHDSILRAHLQVKRARSDECHLFGSP